MSEKTKYSLPAKLVQKIKQEYSIEYEGDNMIRFGRYSPAGQDFGFSVNAGENLNDLRRNIAKAYQDYDCSTEAYLWLDSDGHGKDGAPFEMIDVYLDMQACRDYIDELGALISDYMDEQDRSEQAAELLVPPEMH